MRRGKKYMAASFCLLLTVCLLLPVLPAGAVTDAPDTDRIGAVYLCSLDTGHVLYKKNEEAVIYPASTVKIMTGLLACRTLGNRLDETVTLTSAMLDGVTGRSLHLAVGEKVTIRDLLYAALCGCYNDAASALAVLSSGSVAAFVTYMNQEAARLTATHTFYTNPTGLHDDAMVTTASDTALIAREAYANSLFMDVTSAASYTMKATNVSGERTIYNRNALLSDSGQIYRNGYCRGMSAGMTDEGGWCVVTVLVRDGATLLSVVMQGEDVESGDTIPAYTYTNTLLSWARTNYRFRQVLAPGQVLDTRSVAMTGLSSSKAALVVPDGLSVYLPADVDPEKDLTVTYTLDDGRLSAPLSAGDRVGQVTVIYHDEVIGTAWLSVDEDYPVNGFLTGMTAFRRYLTSRPFFASLVICLLLLFLYFRLWHRPTGRYGVRHTRTRKRR